MIQFNQPVSLETLLAAFSELNCKFDLLKNDHDVLVKDYTDLKRSYDELEGKYEMSQQLVFQYKRMIFGSKSERLLTDVNVNQTSLELDIDPLAELEIKKREVSYTQNVVTVTKNSNHKGRGILPDHLRREVIVMEPEENTEGLKEIGKEVTEILECIPPEFYVKQIIRPKYAKSGNEGVIVAPLPTMPIEKCIAGAYLLATILVDKFVFHLPEYRQQQKFKLSKIDIKKSTMNGWISACCDLLEPLYEVLVKKVLQAVYIQADETTIRVLDKNKKGKSHNGFYWVYNAPLDGLIFFSYHPGRGRAGPEPLLKNFKGYLQSDAYSAYDYFGKQPGITLLNCMTHARRKFVEALNIDKDRAEEILIKFQLLYKVEEVARENNFDHEQRYQLRQEKSIPILEDMHNWLKETAKQVKESTPIAKAIAYSLKRWDKLCLYTTQGFLEIDTNKVENAIRPVALGRKNYLFAGSHDAAQRAAMIYSFFAICKIKDINPYLWLSETLSKIPDWKANRLEELLP